MALGTCTHPEAVDRSARPCRESTSPACARRSANKLIRFQRPELSRPVSVLPPPDRPYPDLTSTHGKGAWPATDAAAGGDRAGSSVGGPSGPNLASLEPVGPGTQKRRGARAGGATGGR